MSPGHPVQNLTGVPGVHRITLPAPAAPWPQTTGGRRCTTSGRETRRCHGSRRGNCRKGSRRRDRSARRWSRDTVRNGTDPCPSCGLTLDGGTPSTRGRASPRGRRPAPGRRRRGSAPGTRRPKTVSRKMSRGQYVTAATRGQVKTGRVKRAGDQAGAACRSLLPFSLACLRAARAAWTSSHTLNSSMPAPMDASQTNTGSEPVGTEANAGPGQ